jgi:hypothetical protein
MNIWFRTDVDQGSGQAVERSRQRYRSVDPASYWSFQWPVSSGTSPIKSRADHSLRRGAACCARDSTADVHHPLADACLTPAANVPRNFTRSAAVRRRLDQPKKRMETRQLSGISTRHRLKSRSYRKQTIKPGLPGTRIAHHGPQFMTPSFHFRKGQKLRSQPATQHRKPSHRI